VVEAPLALEAAGGFGHAPQGDQQSENLPVGAVEVLYVRKAGKVQAGGKCTEREDDGADERFLPQAEDQEEMMHNTSEYAGGAGVRDLRVSSGWRILQTGAAFPQGLKPTIILLKVMYGLKPVPFMLPV
jgi:hypothetical protein